MLYIYIYIYIHMFLFADTSITSRVSSRRPTQVNSMMSPMGGAPGSSAITPYGAPDEAGGKQRERERERLP